jgi:nucleotide-binding universal stress UspA family protein
VTAAAQFDVDVIVVGGDEGGFFGRLLDHSVARALLRDARRPVLVVPPASTE